MTKTDSETFSFTPEKNGDTQVGFTAQDLTMERIDEFVDEYGFKSRSGAIRKLIWMGMRSSVLHDPRTSNPEETSDTGNEGPESAKIKDFVPEGQENAIDVRDELIETIENDLLKAVQEDPDLEMDGWEVYRNER